MPSIAYMYITSFIVAAISGLFFVIMDVFGYVKHNAKWKELNWWQWICFICVVQFPIIMFVTLFVVLLIFQAE